MRGRASRRARVGGHPRRPDSGAGLETQPAQPLRDDARRPALPEGELRMPVQVVTGREEPLPFGLRESVHHPREGVRRLGHGSPPQGYTARARFREGE